jgi:hypothetical protein
MATKLSACRALFSDKYFSSLPPMALFVMFVCFIEEIGRIRSEEGSDNEKEKWNWSYDSSGWNVSDENQFMCYFSGTVI